MFGSTIHVLIVEDDPNQRQLLESMLQPFDYIQIAGTASNASELIARITTSPQISALLLDVDLGEGRNGLESYSSLHLRGIHVPAVLITGSVPEASFTYDLGIVDVLEKPYTAMRFKQAMEKIRNHINYKQFMEHGGMFLPVVNDSIAQVPPSDVLFIESNNRCVYVHTVHETFETKVSLKAYENYLKHHSFIMTHRSYLVNIQKVDYVEQDTIHFMNERQRTALLIEEKAKEFTYVFMNR